MDFIKTHIENNVFFIGLNRPDKMNAFNWQMLNELSAAYELLEHNDHLRVGVLYTTGKHFTSGLDLADVSKHLKPGNQLFDGEAIDPLRIGGQSLSKPLIVAVNGYCLTIGIELFLAADICVASPETTFAQMEVQRGIIPFGGATFRMVQRAGWGNAMQYLLTGKQFSASEALRLGLIQEIDEDPLSKATAIAQQIAAQAPLAVQAILENGRVAIHNETKAADMLYPALMKLMKTEDAKEGLASFKERRKAAFTGK
jgi:enoyl-CoA hydratase/carnithine racemase